MDFIAEFFQTVGPVMFLGLIGVYLIIVSIAGQFVPKNIRLKTMTQRFTLGLFGLVLFTPTLVLLYLEFFTKFTPSVFPPEIQEQIIEHGKSEADRPASRNSEASMQFAYLANFEGGEENTSAVAIGQDQNENWRPMEVFGLTQRNVRRLKHSQFDNDVYVYVNDIHYYKAFDVYVVIDKGKKWPAAGEIGRQELQKLLEHTKQDKIFHLRAQRAGDTLFFDFDGHKYQLRISKIYAVLFGTDKILVEICERDR